MCSNFVRCAPCFFRVLALYPVMDRIYTKSLASLFMAVALDLFKGGEMWSSSGMKYAPLLLCLATTTGA